MNNYTIGQAAKLVGLPTKTIRFYEESGLISKIFRRENGYRIYTQSVIEELKLLKYARDLGLPISEIKKLMKGCNNNNCQHSKQYIQSEITNYLGILENKIQKLKILKTKLKDLDELLRTNKHNCKKDKYCCDLLHQVIDSQQTGGEPNG